MIVLITNVNNKILTNGIVFGESYAERTIIVLIVYIEDDP